MVSSKVDLHKIQQFFNNRYVAWTICIIITAIVFFFNINSIPGLEGDGVKYLNVAENIFKGNGITFGWNALYPWVGSPPLFPYLISLLMHLGFSSLDSANIILSLFFSGSLILIFLIACYKSSRFVGYVSLAICTVSLLMWVIASTVLVDILLMFFILGAIFYLIRYSDHQSLTDLIICSLLLSLAILTKNTAYLFLLATIFIVFFNNSGELKKKLIHISLVALISISPTLIFTLVRFNFIPVNFLFSSGYEFVGLTQGQILHSFISVPFEEWGIKHPLIIGCLILLSITVIVIHYKNKTSFLSLLIPESKTKVLLSFVIIYYFGLMFILLRSGIPLFGRYSIVIFPLVIIYITTIIYQAYQLASQKFSIILILLSLAILIVFILGSLNSTVPYYQWTKNGFMITHPEVREYVPEWVDLASNTDYTIFSNDPWIVQYYSNREVSQLPVLLDKQFNFPTAPMNSINDTFQSFDDRTYIIIFKKIFHNDYGVPYESYVYYNALNGNTSTILRDYPDVTIFRGGNIIDWQNLRLIQGGKITIDVINGERYTNAPLNIDTSENGIVVVEGWAIDDQAFNGSNGDVFLVLSSDDDDLIIRTNKYERSDVASYFENPDYLLSGWSGSILSSRLTDRCYSLSVRVLRENKGEYYEFAGKTPICFT
jgi:4-amino-4-deoxy-L-arabinose transferase-like glycosyltransferase